MSMEDSPTFESTTYNLLSKSTRKKRRMESLYESDKWEFSSWNRTRHDPKYKDHRRKA